MMHTVILGILQALNSITVENIGLVPRIKSIESLLNFKGLNYMKLFLDSENYTHFTHEILLQSALLHLRLNHKTPNNISKKSIYNLFKYLRATVRSSSTPNDIVGDYTQIYKASVAKAEISVPEPKLEPLSYTVNEILALLNKFGARSLLQKIDIDKSSQF